MARSCWRPSGQRTRATGRSSNESSSSFAVNIAGAARMLGINRSTLYYRLRKHGLEHLLPTKIAVGGDEAPATPATPGDAGTSG